MTEQRAHDELYAPAAVAHFTEPRSVGAVADPDGKGSDGDPSCGDRATITLRLARGRAVEAREVIAGLGGLAPRTEACALMAVGALRAALADAYVKAAARP